MRRKSAGISRQNIVYRHHRTYSDPGQAQVVKVDGHRDIVDPHTMLIVKNPSPMSIVCL